MLVYLAGPIRAKDGKTVDDHVREAKGIALELWKKGYAVICPHANTDLPIALADEECDEKVWLNGDLEMVRRCDAVVVMPDWKGSRGTEGEIKFAKKRKIPVYYYPDLPPIPRAETTSPVQCGAFIDTVMDMYRVHVRKNADYSPANILGTGELGVVVRLWDKIARIMNLKGFRVQIAGSTFEEPLDPKNEPLDDAYMDAANYAVIGHLVRKNKWGR